MLRAKNRSGPLLPGAGYNAAGGRRAKDSLRDNIKRTLLLACLAALLFLAALGWSAVNSSKTGSVGFTLRKQEGKGTAQQAQAAKQADFAEQPLEVGDQVNEELLRTASGLGSMGIDCGPGGCKEAPVLHAAGQAEGAGAKLNRPPSPLYNMTATDLDGLEHSLAEYRGKVLLVTNVASQCGYTDSNYKGLQQLYDRFRGRGFEVLAFPCNQFMEQEPGDSATIKDFVTSKYHITFPVFQKTLVNGPEQHPVFGFVKSVMSVTGFDAASWNFAKYLVGRDGYPVRHYQADFNEEQLSQDIERELQLGATSAASQ